MSTESSPRHEQDNATSTDNATENNETQANSPEQGKTHRNSGELRLVQEVIDVEAEVISTQHSPKVLPDISSKLRALHTTRNRFTLHERLIRYFEHSINLPEQVRWLSDAGSWMINRGYRWQRSTDNDLDNFLMERLQDLQAEVERKAVWKEGEQESLLIELQAARKKSGIEELRWNLTVLAGYRESVKEWDTNPELLGAPNGIIELRTGNLLPWQSSLHISRCTKVPMLKPRSKDDLKAYLELIDYMTADNALLQSRIMRWDGYLLTGYTREEKLALIIGAPRIGKGTWTESNYEILGDDYYLACDASVFTEKGLRNPTTGYTRAKIPGRRIVCIDEFANGEKLDEEYLKTFVGGGVTSVREIRGNIIENVRMTARIVATSNHFPVVLDKSSALLARIDVINLPAKRPTIEDPRIKEEIRRNAPYILYYKVMEGARAYLAEQSLVSGVSEREKALSMTGTIGQWLQENFYLDPHYDYFCVANDIFQDYRSWCFEGGNQYVKSQGFPGMMAMLGFPNYKLDGRTSIYPGLRPKVNERFTIETKLRESYNRKLATIRAEIEKLR